MKYILLTISILCIVFTASADGEYRCLCELHPNECADGGMAVLGGTTTQDGITYRILAEAKPPVSEVWFQWVDMAPQGETLDGKCDFVIALILKTDGLYIQKYRCEEMDAVIVKYCQTNGLRVDEILHTAK